MDINKLNYETYIIDYLEDNLDPAGHQAFEKFLMDNPAIRSELDEFLSAPRIEEDPSIKFTKKSDLVFEEDRKLYWIPVLMAIVLISAIAAYIGINSHSKKHEPPQKQLQKKERIIYAEQNKNDADQKATSTMTTAPSDPVYNTEPAVKLIAEANRSNADRVLIKDPSNDSAQNLVPQKASNATQVELQNRSFADSGSIPVVADTRASSPKTDPSFEENAKYNPIQVIAHIGSIPMVDNIDSQTSQVSEDIYAGVLEIDHTALLNSSNQKNSKWWRVFVPQAVEDGSLKGLVAKQNLKPNFKDISKLIKPEILSNNKI